MPAPIQIVLTEEEDRTLLELRVALSVPQRTRDRAHMLRLNAQGWTVPAIAEIFERHEHTVRATIRRWETDGLCGLWEAPGRGAKRRWQEADLQYIEQCLEQEPRTDNSPQLAQKLEQERSCRLSPDRLRHLLQKRATDGNAPATISEANQTLSSKQASKLTWTHSGFAAQEGHIELKYLDESGCSLWSPVSYSYSRVGTQKQLEQTARRGGRISILGLWQPDKSFEYALACGSFKSESYIKVMDWIAGRACQTLTQTGRLTVIVQDNGSLHTSRLTRQQWQRWQAQGLFIFFLPPYCSVMNRIESEWHQLKTHEIAGRMFEDEYDIAMAVMDGMEARSVAGDYALERFKFNSA